MLPIYTILHPTDFSPRSECAFQLACALARDYGARLVLLHVRPLPLPVYSDFGPVFPGEPADTEERLRDRLFGLWPAADTVPVEHRLVAGDPAEVILRTARESMCDLVVMGTH